MYYVYCLLRLLQLNLKIKINLITQRQLGIEHEFKVCLFDLLSYWNKSIDLSIDLIGRNTQLELLIGHLRFTHS